MLEAFVLDHADRAKPVPVVEVGEIGASHLRRPAAPLLDLVVPAGDALAGVERLAVAVPKAVERRLSSGAQRLLIAFSANT
jgi:hypothetical protein